jgi:hypothetical protein
MSCAFLQTESKMCLTLLRMYACFVVRHTKNSVAICAREMYEEACAASCSKSSLTLKRTHQKQCCNLCQGDVRGGLCRLLQQVLANAEAYTRRLHRLLRSSIVAHVHTLQRIWLALCQSYVFFILKEKHRLGPHIAHFKSLEDARDNFMKKEGFCN